MMAPVVLSVDLGSFSLVSDVADVNALSTVLQVSLASTSSFDWCDCSECVNPLVIYRYNCHEEHNISSPICIAHL